MKKLFFLLIILVAVRAFPQCVNGIPIPVTGTGCDTLTSITATPSATDATQATVTWTSGLSSDSGVQIIDSAGNPGQTFYNATMTTSHSILLTGLFVNATGTPQKFNYIVLSCTHAISGAGQCPNAAPDLSTQGIPQRNPGTGNSLNHFTSIARPSGTLTSWTTSIQAPNKAFPGDEFFIITRNNVGAGTVLGGAAGTGIQYLLLHDISVVTPSGTNICGSTNTNVTPNYELYGDTSFNIACTALYGTAGAPAGSPLPTNQDFIFSFSTSPNWIIGGINGIQSSSVATDAVTTSPMQTAGQRGYFINNWTGIDENIYVHVGSAVPTGNYTINFQLQPLDAVGHGNRTGDNPNLTSQNHSISIPLTIVANTPLATSAPSSFPAWSFQPVLLAQAAYWGTWACSNFSDYRSGTGPMALYYNSGTFENYNFSAATWGGWPWNYDGTRNYLAIGDRLFATSHPDWTAATTYTFGDIITDTVSGQSFIMNAVNGNASQGLTGVSGGSRPAFNTITPSGTIGDGLLQWMSIGNAAYWQSCALQAGQGYTTTILMYQASLNQEPDNFPSGMLQYMYRTGDAFPGNETGHTYSESGQKFGITVSPPLADPSQMCWNSTTGQVETGTSTYWTGGERLALCYMAATTSNLGLNANANNIGTVRLRALQLQNEIAYWRATNDPNWINTDDGLRTQRMVNTSIALLNIFETLPASNFVTNSTSTFGMAPFYQSSQLAEALIHWHQATLDYSNTTNYPCPSGAYTQCVTEDTRVPIVIKTYADWAWVNEFDIEYDKNQVIADNCVTLYPTICQTARRLHSYSFPYNRWMTIDASVAYTFWTEAASNGEVAPVYSWLWAYNSTLVPPTNGRGFVASSYRDIALYIMQHAYDGRLCTVVVGTTPGTCNSWNVADYYNGGRKVGNGGFNGLVTSNKTVQQTIVNAVSEALPWATGALTYKQGVMSPSVNPCWIVGNRNTTPGSTFGLCTVPSPFPDTMAPYTLNWYINAGRPGQIYPTTCRPGTIGNNNTSDCRLTQTFGTNHVQMNSSSWISGTLSNTSARFNFMTAENATCDVVVDTPAIEPAHVPGVNTFTDSASPTLAGGTPVPLWFHTILATGLIPSQPYHYGIYCTDSSGNIANLPYQVTSSGCPTNAALCKFAISFGTADQAQTFTTTLLPTGADVFMQPGVTITPGVKVK